MHLLNFISASGSEIPLSPWLGAVAGGMLSILALAILLALRMRRSRNDGRVPPQSHDKLWPPPEPTAAGPRLPPAMRSVETQPPTELIQDDKDPDVIPANYGEWQYRLNFRYFRLWPVLELQ
jgi:hypothetical protein